LDVGVKAGRLDLAAEAEAALAAAGVDAAKREEAIQRRHEAQERRLGGELRAECIRMAIQVYGASNRHERVLEAAKAFEAYIMGAV